MSDGDVAFQPRKIQRSGLWEAVSGRVLLYVHKEQMVEAVQRLYPAKHYAMVDDKVLLLAAVKGVLGDRLTTVRPRQGHYALNPATASMATKADVTIQHIGDLMNVDRSILLARRQNAWNTGDSSLCS